MEEQKTETTELTQSAPAQETANKGQKDGQLLLLVKIQTAMLAVLLVLLAAGGIFAAVQVNRAMQLVNAVDMNRVNTVVASLQEIAADLDMENVGKTVETLQGAAKGLADLDMDAVNDGIQALTEAAENLQSLDVEQLNDLIASLEQTAAQMEKTTAAFGRLFGK